MAVGGEQEVASCLLLPPLKQHPFLFLVLQHFLKNSTNSNKQSCSPSFNSPLILSRLEDTKKGKEGFRHETLCFRAETVLFQVRFLKVIT
jgi:hypothetical protein